MRNIAIFSLLFTVALLFAGGALRAEEAPGTSGGDPHSGTEHGEAHAEGHDGHGGEEGKFDVKELLFHHILDSHNWHILDIPAGDHNIPVSIPLPWIIYTEAHGLDVFFITGHAEAERQAQAAARGYDLHHEEIHVAGDHDAMLLDFSITKTVAQMMLIAILMILVFTAVAKGYQRRKDEAPKGVQAFLEPVIEFVRNDIAVPNLHGKHDKYLPLLLTLFFFIWFSNMLGLIPINSNIMGNISVTAALAVIALLVVNFSGTKDYWRHIFWFPGVPLLVKFIMLPVELLGVFSRPFALMVRLFANIVAGHFMILALVSLIFLLGENGENLGGGIGASVLAVLFSLFIMSLEVLVAAIQAYVFALLTAIFIGMALETHDHHDHEEHGEGPVTTHA